MMLDHTYIFTYDTGFFTYTWQTTAHTKTGAIRKFRKVFTPSCYIVSIELY